MSLTSFKNKSIAAALSGNNARSRPASPYTARMTSGGEFPPPCYREGDSDYAGQSSLQHLYVLPVLLLEFAALALTRAALPSMLVNQYGDRVYVVMGLADCIRGLFAFVACPIFGKLSDLVGRRLCLFVTVLGTCAPVCSLAFFTWESVSLDDTDVAVISLDTNNNNTSDLGAVDERNSNFFNGNVTTNSIVPDDTTDAGGFWPLILGNDDPAVDQFLHPHALNTFVLLLSLSGIFSSTFTLVFAYISDTVKHQEERVSAYGLALATFGLSFTIGPIAGGYLARAHKQYVFVASFVLTILDLMYIFMILPESKQGTSTRGRRDPLS